MTPFEEQLKQALARREPSPDFAARVVAIAANGRKLSATARLQLWFHGTRTWRWAPAMAALLVMSGGAVYEQHQRAARGEAAKEKLLIAMRIAGSEMHRAQHRIFDVETAEATQ